MVPMTSSTSFIRPRPTRPFSSRPPTDVFRPRFPLDPFASARQNLREPWFLKYEQLPSVASQPRRDVILIFGAPTAKDLSPLLLSKHLANSLLIIASHEPPEIPHTTLPSVRTLCLSERLDIEDAGAVRFVNVLEWAERVGRVWRKHGGVGAVQLSEDDDGQDHVPPPSIFRFASSQSTPPSPRSSSVRLTAELVSGRPRSASSSKILNSFSRSRRSPLPVVDPTQRPFDGIINFLPKNTSDKALLKQAILVTTISRPFLMAASSGTYSSRPATSTRRSFFGSRSTTSVYLPPTPPYSGSGESLNTLPPLPAKAHILHLLPHESRSFNASARSKLIRSLESFLISFAYPTSLDASYKDDSMERARPYLMQVSRLPNLININTGVNSPKSTPDISNSPYESDVPRYTVADLVLYGSLDGIESPNASPNPNAKQPPNPLARLTPRAWISGPNDIVLLPEDGNVTNPNVLSTPPSPSAAPATSPPNVSYPGTYSNTYSPPGSSPFRPSTSPTKYQTLTRPPYLSSHADNSFSSALSTSISGSTASSSPGSPLAYDHTRHYARLNINPGTSGLPTPPDSDESGSDIVPTSELGPGLGHAGEDGRIAIYGWRKRAVSSPGAAFSADGVDGKKKKTKWKFWRTAR